LSRFAILCIFCSAAFICFLFSVFHNNVLTFANKTYVRHLNCKNTTYKYLASTKFPASMTSTSASNTTWTRNQPTQGLVICVVLTLRCLWTCCTRKITSKWLKLMFEEIQRDSMQNPQIKPTRPTQCIKMYNKCRTADSLCLDHLGGSVLVWFLPKAFVERSASPIADGMEIALQPPGQNLWATSKNWRFP
jgi:hypothetical protein